MSFVSADRVRETSTTTGTGTYNLAGAVAGYRTFVAGIGDNNTCHYLATMGNDWELGLGTVGDASPDTLARTRVLKSSNADAAVSWGAGDKTISCVPIAARIRDVVTPKGYLFGLITANNGTDATNDIDIGAGQAIDETGEVVMELTATLTKQIDAAWAVGSAAGGMNTGSVANATWYEVILIYRQDTGVTDVMFSTTANRNTLPTNYTHKRRIGWVRRGTATNLAYTQVDDHFTLTTQINDGAATITATATALTLTVPPNSIARFRATCLITALTAAAVTGIVFSEIVEGNVTPSLTTGILSLAMSEGDGTGTANDSGDAGHFELRANSSSQIEWDGIVGAGSAGEVFDVSTFGWIDGRGRLS